MRGGLSGNLLCSRHAAFTGVEVDVGRAEPIARTARLIHRRMTPTEITCPWCIIGHHRLDKILAERFPDLEVGIRQHPVLLLPDALAEGLYIPDLLRKRYGMTAPQGRVRSA